MPTTESRATAPVASDRYVFRDFRIEVGAKQLFRLNVHVPLAAKAFDTLLALVRKHGEVVTKDELISEVWPDTFVSEDSLTQNISALRRILEDDPAQPRFIATVSRRGYQFVAPVATQDEAAAASADNGSSPSEVPSHATTSSSEMAGIRAGPVPEWQRTARRWIPFAAVLVVGVIAGSVISSRAPRADLAERRLRFAPELPAGSTLAAGGVVSPDGRQVAFVARDEESGNTRLWIRTLSTAATRVVPGSEGALRPFWAPDSQSIAFFGANKLQRASLSGGMPTLVCDTTQPRPSGGTWNERGEILFADAYSLFVVPALGGQPRRVRTPSAERNEVALEWPQFLPGGRSFLYEVSRNNDQTSGTYISSLDGDEQLKLLSVPGTQIAYSRGHLIYLQDRRLIARPFDPATLRLTGEPILVADDLSRFATVSAASDAAVIAFGGTAAETLTWFDRSGRAIGTVDGPTPLRNLALSPHEHKLIGEGVEAGQRGIWLIDLTRNVTTRLVADGTYPMWLPDGNTVIFSAGREPGAFGMYARNIDELNDELLLKRPQRPIVTDVTRDGRFVVFTLVVTPDTRQDIWVARRSQAATPTLLISSPAREIQAQVSPDGKWIAYASDEENSAFEVYVQAFPGLGHKRRVSSRGGTQPQWRSDGKELFYLSADQTVMSVAVTPGPTLELGASQPLFRPSLLGLMSDFRNQYTVTPDGSRFVVSTVAQTGAREPITLVVNWRAAAE
jgi:eukaryotic-like serine/threonine-protein kinase